MDSNTIQQFSSVDYAVLLGLLIIPSSIGIYFAIKDRKHATTDGYFFGERRMPPVAVGISTAVTSISAITMIGYPSEVYLVGTVFAWAPLAIITAAIVNIIYYIPFYGRLRLETIYGYLELRFNRFARLSVAFMVPLTELFYLGTIVYLPALALNAVAPISLNMSIGITGGICTFYTTLGGMKAVVWTDVFQSTLMLGASVAVLGCGIASVGGVGEIYAALERGQRLTFSNFDSIELSSRISPIGIFVGEFFMYNNYLAFAQPIYQRIQSCKNTKQSSLSIVSYAIPAMCIIFVAIANGLVMYGYFEGCDPVLSGLLKSRDQGMPYIAMQLFSSFPGLSGLYVAAVFSGSLSTVSSGLNAYSTVIVEDFFPVMYPRISERSKLLVGKLSAFILGAVVVASAYISSFLGSSVFKFIRCFTGAIGGPVLGMYLLGIFFPWANSAGAIAGAGIGYATMVWIFLGSNFLVTSPQAMQLPITTESCLLRNKTATHDVTTVLPLDELTTFSTAEQSWHSKTYRFDQMIYRLNFHYYVLAGALITIVVGLLVSIFTGRNRPSEADSKLFMPLLSNSWLPGSVRKFFRCGVPESSDEFKRRNSLKIEKDDCHHETTALNA